MEPKWKATKATAENALLCALRLGFYSWDAINLRTIKESWDTTRIEIEKRIAILKAAKDWINDSLMNRSNKNLGKTKQSDLPIVEQVTMPLTGTNNSPDLNGRCIEADLATGESNFESGQNCNDNESFIPTNNDNSYRQRIAELVPGSQELLDEIDSAKGSIDSAVSSTAPLDKSIQKSGAKIRSYLPTLLAVKKKIDKDRGKTNEKSFMDSFFEAGKIRNQQQKDFIEAFKKAGGTFKSPLASLKKINKKGEKSSISKVKVNDDKKVDILKTYKLKDYKLKKKTKEENVGELRKEALKKYNVKQDSIHKKTGVSIWKLINSRYLKSAYPRLFEEK